MLFNKVGIHTTNLCNCIDNFCNKELGGRHATPVGGCMTEVWARQYFLACYLVELNLKIEMTNQSLNRNLPLMLTNRANLRIDLESY